MDEGVKEPPRGTKRKERHSWYDNTSEELQKARDQEFVRLHGESGIGKDLDDKAIERGIFMASKRDTTYQAAEQRRNSGGAVRAGGGGS